MTIAAFDYVRARDLDHAISLLREHDGAKLLAGGHSLLPMMKLRLTMPSLLIDVAGLDELRGIRPGDGGTTIGALTTHHEVASDARLRERVSGVTDAAAGIGDVQVRNRGTIGGSSAHGDPAADYPAMLLALDATFALAGPNGRRAVAARDFFRGMFDTALEPGEVLVAVTVRDAPASAYLKMEHPASGYAVVGAGVALDLDGATIAQAAVAISGVGAGHVRLPDVEGALRGVRLDDSAAIANACRDAARGADALGDRFASAEYRVAMTDVFVERAVRRAAQRPTPP